MEAVVLRTERRRRLLLDKSPGVRRIDVVTIKGADSTNANAVPVSGEGSTVAVEVDQIDIIGGREVMRIKGDTQRREKGARVGQRRTRKQLKRLRRWWRMLKRERK